MVPFRAAHEPISVQTRHGRKQHLPKLSPEHPSASYYCKQSIATLPNMNNRSPFRGGMQVHAVPETERAIGANGQRLPWAYEYAE